MELLDPLFFFFSMSLCCRHCGLQALLLCRSLIETREVHSREEQPNETPACSMRTYCCTLSCAASSSNMPMRMKILVFPN